jgi:hypothetical protein
MVSTKLMLCLVIAAIIASMSSLQFTNMNPVNASKKVFDESVYGDNNEHRPELKIKERGNDFCILKNDDTNGANTSVGTSGMVFGTGDFASLFNSLCTGLDFSNTLDK